MTLFLQLKMIEKDKVKILNANIMKKYKDNVIQGTLRNNNDCRIKQIFKIIKEHFLKLTLIRGFLFISMNIKNTVFYLIILLMNLRVN